MSLPLPLNHSDFHILLALVAGPRHGYGIMQEVERDTEGLVHLGPGTLYAALQRLLEAGWVEEVASREQEADFRRRRYYRLTPSGRRALEQEARRVAQLLQLARQRGLLAGPWEGGEEVS